MSAHINEFLAQAKTRVETVLDRVVPSTTHIPGTLHEAMRYSLMAGGKRLRPGLCYAAFEDCGGRGEAADWGAAALEMVHTFSLIHDDLPCMDDDDFRRGMPTCHKKFGEAMAVLAGDALSILAFQVLARAGNAQAISVLADALGSDGMLGGQVVDILSEGKPCTLETVDYIHVHKTSALIEASLELGAVLAGADESRRKLYRDYGRAIGLAFQIVDDILDIESSTEELGKDVGSDVENQKATYPAVVGLEESKKRARQLVDHALQLTTQMGPRGPVLADLARFIVERGN
ncbi:MAG TPA: polyprenyl synthetase family protein [Fibrobacteria bacterium]|nr:polyprenyl synthetase family protein [Fibrobacteria bacterium]HOX52047.1 polyprenyl synthetase family protein [Fibrobacteria bacterium]